MSIYKWIIAGCWLVFVIVWIAAAQRTKKSSSGHGAQTGWGARVIGVIAVFSLFYFHVDLSADWAVLASHPILGLVGDIICGAGIGFAVWARVHLGRNWGMPMTQRAEPELVTSGPYTYVRHPIYTGVLSAMLGSTLAVGPVWLVVFVFYGAYFIYAAFREEKTMVERFPNQYPDYKKRTKMLVPFIF